MTNTVPRTFILYEGVVADYERYDGPSVISQLRVGDSLTLRREPDHLQDEWAIEVLTTSGRKLGYVPKPQTGIIAELMDEGLTIKAEIDYLDPSARDWEAIYFRITFRGLVEVELEACPSCGSTRRLPDGRCGVCCRMI